MFPNESEGRGNPTFSERLVFPTDSALFKMLESHAQTVPCDEDRTLFRQGDEPLGVFLIRSGTVNAIIYADGGEVVAFFHGAPGAVLGLPATLCNQPYSLSATARQGSDIAFVARTEFDKFVQDQPTPSVAILRVLAAEVHLARQALASILAEP